MKQAPPFILALLLLCNAITYAQLPKPTLISSQKYSATGAGTSGIPTVTYTIPNGTTNKNRVLVVSYNIERFHNPANSNWFANLDGYVYNSGTIVFVDPNVAGLGSSTHLAGHSFYSYSPTDSARLSMMTRARYFSIPDGVTGNLTVTFPGLNTPKSASDEMSVIVATFENVKSGNSLNTGGSNVNFSGTTVATASATQPAIPLGRTSEDLLYLVTGAMSQQSALTLSSGWTSIQSNVVTNSATATYSSLYPNEPDGISHILGRRYGASGYDPGITLTRPSGSAVQTSFGAAKFSALYPLASPSVSGTVFRDTDGSTNINGSGTHAGGLYVNVIDADNKLVYSAAVNSDGTFTIPNGYVVETYHYKFELSKNTGTIGAAAPAKALPTGWETVGESTSPSGNDGTANGTINVTIGSSDRTGLRFGINSFCAVESVYLSSFNGQSNTTNIFANNVIGIGSSRISVTHTTYGNGNLSTNRISDTHYAGEYGLNLGHSSGNTTTFSDRIETQLAFSNPVKDFRFTINDLDAYDRIRVLAYDQNNTLIPISSYNYSLYANTVITYYAPSGTTYGDTGEFQTPGSDISSNDPGRRAAIDFTFPNVYISRIVLQYYDTNTSGTYTIAKFSGVDGATCPPVNYCVSGCNGNAFLHTSDLNTLEYDNFISGFHSSIIKKTDNAFMI
ncbi:MAG: hypothetical protein KF862_17590 [Chitinophagaceae bacterium]|nr:hypothetical protein [Chitinophagaceae bacterium]